MGCKSPKKNILGNTRRLVLILYKDTKIKKNIFGDFLTVYPFNSGHKTKNFYVFFFGRFREIFLFSGGELIILKILVLVTLHKISHHKVTKIEKK
jgi:hypothetical protein